MWEMKPIEKIKITAKEMDLNDALEKFLDNHEIVVGRGEVFAIKKNSELAKRYKKLISKYYLKTIYIGKKLGRLVSTSSSDFYYTPWRLYESSVEIQETINADLAKQAVSDIQPGEKEIRARLSVTYKLR